MIIFHISHPSHRTKGLHDAKRLQLMATANCICFKRKFEEKKAAEKTQFHLIIFIQSVKNVHFSFGWPCKNFYILLLSSEQRNAPFLFFELTFVVEFFLHFPISMGFRV